MLLVKMINFDKAHVIHASFSYLIFSYFFYIKNIKQEDNPNKCLEEIKMTYDYIINGIKQQCFYNRYPKIMTVYDRETYNRIGFYEDFDVVEDENGKRYFEVNGEKVMFNDYICYTPQELIANFKNCRDYNLCQTLMKYGMDSIRVMIRKKELERIDFCGVVVSFEVSSPRDSIEDFDWVEYKFVNEDFSNPQDCYKLKMIPVDEKLREIYGAERTYVSDLVSLMQNCTELYQVKANMNV